jgi:imidazole glycerol phosphate synthase glutamine amidotransferase subunit
VLAGLRRAGVAPRVTEEPAEVAAAIHVVLPGVGTLGAAMLHLHERQLDVALAARVRAGRPTLAICLGMQILCEGSDESPEVPGLGVVPGRARRFPDSVRVPQLGWNQVETSPGCVLLRSGHAYFANSYRLEAAPPGWHAGFSDHGGPWVAALERGAVLACQFHPELSGRWGLELLQRWLALVPATISGEPQGGRTC